MKLALNGGDKVRKSPFPFFTNFDEREKERVMNVLESGRLSSFLGLWHDDFFGGTEVQLLEKKWAAHFKVKHAITVNSCTSGLFCAIGAIGIEPGDEVIVPPFTMSATVMAPLIYGAIPVFADVESDFYCIDPLEIEKKITKRTKAIMAVDLFGQPYAAKEIKEIAKRYNLKIIEDVAQGPGAKYDGKFAGTLGDIGVYSLNYHKHIHCGEGGVVVTDDDELANRIRLIRNHAESVVGAKGETDLVNMVGFNYRMSEIHAAIANIQLDKLTNEVSKRRDNAKYLHALLSQLPMLSGQLDREFSENSHYIFTMKYNHECAGVDRNTFMNAVRAELTFRESRETEGPMIGYGYVKPLYMLPLFQNRIAFGSKGYPFTLIEEESNISYAEGSCPVVERLHKDELVHTSMIDSSMSRSDLDDIFKAFEKVWENRAELKVKI